MAGSRHRIKIKGRHQSNKHSSNTNNNLLTESSQSQSYSNPKSLNKPLYQAIPETENSDKQMEKFVSEKLEGIYKEAHMKLISYGYEHNEALNAMLINGHAFGDNDVITNIVHNSLNHISTGQVLDNATQDFGDLRRMVGYSLTKMINLLRQGRPNLTKRQAMGCLFLSNFQLGVAPTKNLPIASNKTTQDSRIGPLQKDFVGECKREPKSLKRFNLTPALTCQLKKNVAHYSAAYRANMKVSSEPPPQIGNNSQPTKDPLDGFEWEESCMVNEVLGDFCSKDDRRLESEPVDPKIETILSLVDQIKKVRKEEKERKEWAERKVIQAAEKLNGHLMELSKLRMERVKIQQAEHQKLDSKQARMKKLTETEEALREASSQVDLADASLMWLEGGNAKMRAEMEAFKLNKSESDKLCLEAGKKERKLLKMVMALEKQNNKLQQQIAEEKNKTLQLQQQLTRLKKAQEDIEVSWRYELQEKDLAMTQVKEELRLKGEEKIKFKSKHDHMYQKIEVDCQCYKDDVQRLEHEISNVQLSLESDQLPAPLRSKLEHERLQKDTFATTLSDLSVLRDSSKETCSRTCLICLEKEASVVVLPCAHQVLCAGCNKDHCRRNVEHRCPCCQALISETIHVYGLSS